MEKKLIEKRKLASIQEIKSLEPIEDDSNLEVATVLGWKVVVNKGEFKVNEKIIYFEIDSKFLPDQQYFPNLEMYDCHIPTVIISKVVSQGLILSLNNKLVSKYSDCEVGKDLTEELDITKYEEDEEAEKNISGKLFPKHLLPITDEIRIQSEPGFYKLFKGKPYVATLKMDGQSGTFVLNPEDKEDLWMCSRNKFTKDYKAVATKYKLKEKLQKYPHLAFQGEVYGPGIMKNPFGVKDKCFSVFTIFDLNTKICLDYDEMVKICTELDIPYVQCMYRGDSFDYDEDSLDELHKLTLGNYEGTNSPKEGLVFRLQKNWYSPLVRASFKIISNEYLTEKEKPKKK